MRSPVPIAATLLVALFASLAAPGFAASPPPTDADDPTWVTDGSVQALARDGQTLYLGGTFQRLSPRTGSMLQLDGDGTLKPRLEVDGDIDASIPDGEGGFVIAGAFTAVDGVPRDGIARLRHDGSLDPGFVPPTVAGRVDAIAVSGTTVFLGGGITAVGATARNNLAALDLTTGALLPFNQGVRGFSDTVETLLVSGTTLYVGGSFNCSGVFNGDGDCSDAGETSIGMLAAMSTTSNAGAGSVITAFAPEPNQTVSSLLLEPSLNTLYVGGDFTCLPDTNNNQGCDGGAEVVRRNVAAVNPTTGALISAFNADVSTPGSFSSVGVLARDTGALVLGGTFTCVRSNGDTDCNDAGEVPRQRLARVNLTTGAVDPNWQPAANGQVRALQKVGDAWWVGGDFSVMNEQPREHFAVVDDGIAGALRPLDLSPDGSVRTFARVNDPALIVVGGTFRGAGGVKRAGLAAIDLQTGAPTAWNPDAGASAQIRALAVDGGTVYVGGNFVTLGGQARPNLGAVDASSGAVRAWNPQPNGGVYALAVGGGAVYAGGSFGQVGATPGIVNLAKIDAATGLAQAGFPTTGSGTNALALRDQTLYVAGGFGQLGGVNRSNAGAIDLATGTVTPWNPHMGGTIASMALGPDRVYLGGQFSEVNLQPGHVAVAAVDTATGTLIPGWNANASSGGTTALSLDGDDLYVATLSQAGYGGTTTYGLARLAAADGALRTDWIPVLPGSVYAVDARGGAVAAGGYFDKIGPSGNAGLATFTPAAANLGAPVVTGTAAVGGSLSCALGDWRGNPLLSRQWLRGGAPIAGATAEAYAVTAEDPGQSLACRVSGVTIRGAAAATSNAVAVPAVVPPPPPPRRLTLEAVLGRSVKKAGSDVVVTYGANLALRGVASTVDGGLVPGVKVAVSRRFGGAKVDTLLASPLTGAKGAFAYTVKKPLRNTRFTATVSGRTASVSMKLAPALKSTTRTKQSGGRVTLAGTIKLPTLKKAGTLRVERKSGKKYKKVKTLKSFSRGRFSLKTAQKRGTTTYRVRFLPRSANTYAAAVLTLKVKRTR